MYQGDRGGSAIALWGVRREGLFLQLVGFVARYTYHIRRPRRGQFGAQVLRNSQDEKGYYTPRGDNIGEGQNGGRNKTRLIWQTTIDSCSPALLTNPNLDSAGEILGVFHEGVNYVKL